MSFYFHEVLKYLNTFTNFWFERVLRFALEFTGFFVTRIKMMARKSLMWVKNISLSQNKYYCNFYVFLKRRIYAFVGKLENRCLCWFPAAMLVSHGVSIKSLACENIRFSSLFAAGGSYKFNCEIISLCCSRLTHSSKSLV